MEGAENLDAGVISWAAKSQGHPIDRHGQDRFAAVIHMIAHEVDSTGGSGCELGLSVESGLDLLDGVVHVRCIHGKVSLGRLKRKYNCGDPSHSPVNSRRRRFHNQFRAARQLKKTKTQHTSPRPTPQFSFREAPDPPLCRRTGFSRVELAPPYERRLLKPT